MKSKGRYIGVKTLEVLEGADNYNAWIASAIKPFIKSPALEVGAGTGNLSEFFTNLQDLTLTDVDPKLVDHLRHRFTNKRNVHVEIFDISKQLYKIKNKFKTVYSVNVLEHIENDEKALRNMSSLLVAGGRVVILVPAKKRAYKKLDKHLGHYRRYEKEELAEKMNRVGLEVEYISYFNTVGLLSWLIRDYIGGSHPDLKPSHVKIFDFFVPVLRVIEPRRRLPIGISLIAVGKKI